MSEVGDAQATDGLSMADAVAAFEAYLTEDGDGDGEATLGEEDPQPEGEPEPEEGDEPPEEEPEDGEEHEDGDEQPPSYRVKIAGEEVEVPLTELIKGYSREADYTRKTMAHGETVKAFEAERQQFSAERERTTNLLRALEQTFSAPAYTQEQLDFLRVNNPAEYAAAVADEVRRRDQAATVQAERQRLERQSEADRRKAFEEAAQSEHAKLLEVRPDWKDETKQKAAMDAAKAYAKSLGVTDEEFDSTDHRTRIALYDAAQYRALQAKAPKVRERVEAVRTATPGSAVRPGRATEVARAQKRLTETGSVDDAARVFLHMQR